MRERAAQPFAIHLLDRLMPLDDLSVIDVAAGTGGLAVVAAMDGARVMATVVSPAMNSCGAERLHPFTG